MITAPMLAAPVLAQLPGSENLIELLVILIFFLGPLLRGIFGGRKEPGGPSAPRRGARPATRPKGLEQAESRGAELWKQLLRGEFGDEDERRPARPSDGPEPSAEQTAYDVREAAEQKAREVHEAAELARARAQRAAAEARKAARERAAAASSASQAGAPVTPVERLDPLLQPLLSEDRFEDGERTGFGAADMPPEPAALVAGVAPAIAIGSIEIGSGDIGAREIGSGEIGYGDIELSALDEGVIGGVARLRSARPALARVRAAARRDTWAQAWVLSEVLGPAVTQREDGGLTGPPGLR